MLPQVTPSSPTHRPSRRWLIRATAITLGLLIATSVWQRERLWVWYCAERLARSSDGNRTEWADRLAGSGDLAVPTLLRLLQQDDPAVCQAARNALDSVARTMEPNEARRVQFANQFLDAEPRFSSPGRAAGLDLLPMLLAVNDETITGRVRQMLIAAIQCDSGEVRIQAVAAVLRPEMNALDLLVPLVNDQLPEVRRAALLALGPRPEGTEAALDDDSLLRCLHDPDTEVRRLAEMGLRSRGRTTRDIRLGRRYTAPDAAERQKLLLDLSSEQELDVAVWLERLTRDEDPAVRAGAIRLAFARATNLKDRLEKISQQDPDGMVRRIARYYHERMPSDR